MERFTFSDEKGTLIFDLNALCCIAQIPIDLSGFENIRILGTGFYFGTDEFVVTAKHLFTRCDKQFGPPFIFNLGGNGELGLAGHICDVMGLWTHGSLDVAMLRSGGRRPLMTPFLPGSHQQVDGAGLVTIGYSPSRSAVHSMGWKCHISVNRCEMLEVEGRERTDEPTEFSILFRAPFGEKGNSGGPVLNSKGRVVGVFSEICSNVKSTDAGTVFTHGRATSLTTLIDLLKEQVDFDAILPELKQWLTGDIDSSERVKAAMMQFTPEQWANLEEICRLKALQNPAPRSVPIWVESPE